MRICLERRLFEEVREDAVKTLNEKVELKVGNDNLCSIPKERPVIFFF